MAIVRTITLLVMAPFHAIARIAQATQWAAGRDAQTHALLSMSDIELKRRGLSRDALVHNMFLGQLYA